MLLHSEAFSDDLALPQVAAKHGLEGMVSKRRDAPYKTGTLPSHFRV
jgi:ATP-dependent DNA ligase